MKSIQILKGGGFFFPVLQDSEPENSVGNGDRLEKKSLRKKKVSKSKSWFFDILPNFLLFSSRLLHHTHRHPQIVGRHLVQSLPVPMQNGAGDRLLKTYKKSVPGTVPALARKIQNKISEWETVASSILIHRARAQAGGPILEYFPGTRGNHFWKAKFSLYGPPHGTGIISVRIEHQRRMTSPQGPHDNVIITVRGGDSPPQNFPPAAGC